MIYILSFLLFAATVSASAQIKFASYNLQKMFEKLPSDCRSDLIERQECNCLVRGVEYNIACKIDKGQISKLGLRVFNDSIINNHNHTVCSFIEGELLKFILDDSKTRETRRKEDQVFLFYSNLLQESAILRSTDPIMRVTADTKGIVINLKNNKYKIEITNTNGESLLMEFPAVNSLITGMDKKELEEDLFKSLMIEKETFVNDFNNHFGENLYTNGDLLVSEGETFLIDGFSSRKYFIRINDSLKLVFDPKYSVESFSNLFLTGESNNQAASIKIKIKGYDNEDKSLTMLLDKFLANFENQHEFYFGIEDSLANNLRGSLIIFNPALNYIHLCDIKTDSGTLFANHPFITVALYSFIPTHNIKNLFGKEGDDKSLLIKNILEDEYEK